MKTKQAKDFLMQQTAEQAARENARLSDIEKRLEDRAIPGHWEGDLLRGSVNSHIATLVERHSRLC